MKDIVIKDAKADMTLPPDLTEKKAQARYKSKYRFIPTHFLLVIMLARRAAISNSGFHWHKKKIIKRHGRN